MGPQSLATAVSWGADQVELLDTDYFRFAPGLMYYIQHFPLIGLTKRNHMAHCTSPLQSRSSSENVKPIIAHLSQLLASSSRSTVPDDI